jgi:hypothetical protein
MVFKNQQKVNAICQTYQLHKNYETISKTWKQPEDLMKLPFIGKTTCQHLARNIGLQSCVKPDLHLKRLILKLFGNDKEEFVI